MTEEYSEALNDIEARLIEEINAICTQERYPPKVAEIVIWIAKEAMMRGEGINPSLINEKMTQLGKVVRTDGEDEEEEN